MWVPTVYCVKYAEDKGFSEEEADLLVFFIGLGSLTLRLPTMMLADCAGRKLSATAVLITYGASNICVPFVADASESYGMASLFWIHIHAHTLPLCAY